ncbi:MAG: arginase family protein [Candidatus Wallbacteria bacterium]|nr:arginase family protein [Candidatus Wallbacteria bacterium]
MKYILGIPSAWGSFFNGPEVSPAAIREAGLIDAFKSRDVVFEDLGDLQLLPLMSRHSVPPIRHYPSPRIVWELTLNELEPVIRKSKRVLLLGGDCSIVVGSMTAMHNVYGNSAYLLYLDGHMDCEIPVADKCAGAAGFGLYLLTEQNPFWPSPAITEQQLLIAGVHVMPANCKKILPHLSLAKMRKTGIRDSALKILSAIGADMKILVHLDVDVMNQESMPAAYSPSEEGLTLDEMQELLSVVMHDQRVKLLEITEFDPLKDPEGKSGADIVKLLSGFSW